MQPENPQWGPTTIIDTSAAAANLSPQAGFNPETVQGLAGDVGTKAVEAAGVVAEVGSYDHLFATDTEAIEADAAANKQLTPDIASNAERAKVSDRDRLAKNMDLTAKFGPANFNPEALKK